MIDMKCPFCQRKLKTFAKYKDGTSTVYCSKCNLFGDSKLFSELIRTRKALDVAKDAIDVISLKYHKDTPSMFLIKYAQNAKAEISALEQGGDNGSNS